MHKTTQEEIIGIYHQVYQLRRKPREVPCSWDMAEETHIENLEMLREHLWHKWDPTQPEKPRWRSTGTRTTRTPAQVKFHTQMQATCDHFGHLWDRQQEFQEEALRVARYTNCQVLATATMLEGHIEQPSCYISHGWHSSQGQSGSHWQSRSGGHLKSRRYRRSHRGQTHLPVACPEQLVRRQVPLPSPAWLRRRVTFDESNSEEDTNVKEVPQTPSNESPPPSWPEDTGIGDPSDWS